MTDDDLVAEHLVELRFANRRPGTIYQRNRVLTRLRADLPGTTQLLDATTSQIEGFLGREGIQPVTRAMELAHVRQFYKWLVRRGHLAADPTMLIQRPKVPRRLPRPIADERLTRALDNAPDRIRPWLYLAAYAGLRACEVAQLRQEDLLLDLDPPLLVVRESKGGGMSSIPLNPGLVAELRRTEPGPDGYLFPRHDGQPGQNRPWTVSQLANRYLRSIGIEDTFHSLRHWFGTQTYRASGRDIRMTQELMRHRSPVSTAIYTFVDPGEAATVVSRLPELSHKAEVD